MPFDGSGNYIPAAAPNFPAVAGTVISAAHYNAVINDIATALSNTLTRDGQGRPTTAINWNAKDLTNVAAFGAVSGAFSGNVTIGGTATVTGAATFSSNATVGGDLTVTGALNLATPLAVTKGGTGAATLTSGALLKGNGTGALSSSLFAEAGSTMSLFGNLLFAGVSPTLTFNTGGPAISSPTANTLTVGTSGVERIRVTNTGNVGIGTGSPNALLDVAGAVRATSLSQRVSSSRLILNGGQSLATDGASIILRGSGDPFNGHGLELYTGNSEAARITSAGRVGVNVSDPGYTLDIRGKDTTGGLGYAMRIRANPTANGATIQFTDSNVTEERGIIVCNTTGISIRSQGARPLTFFTNGTQAGIFDTGQNLTVTQNITAFSDERLKTDIRTIDKALDKVRHMRGVTFTRKDNGSLGTGVIAQEMLTVMPEVVVIGEEYMSVAYGNLVGVLIEAVKELADKVDRSEGAV